MKAFLSHSSKDKELVRSVAYELGRQFCLFDEQAFETGVEFRDSIENSFEKTSLFVFFASQEALKSAWVEFEIEEAWYGNLQGSLRHAVVFLIDSSLTPAHVPRGCNAEMLYTKIVHKQYHVQYESASIHYWKNSVLNYSLDEMLN